MKIPIIIIMIFLIGALFIISENKLALKDAGARAELGRLYLSWFNQLFENSKTLVGYVVKLGWLPDNRTG